MYVSKDYNNIILTNYKHVSKMTEMNDRKKLGANFEKSATFYQEHNKK